MASPRPSNLLHAHSDTASTSSASRTGHVSQSSHIDIRKTSSRSRTVSASIAGSLNSMSQQTPARSYVQRSYHHPSGALETPQSNANDIREDTAELASRAVEESSLYSGSSPVPRFWDEELGNRFNTQEHASLAHRQSLSRLRRDGRDDHWPQAIREESEPSSPTDGVDKNIDTRGDTSRGKPTVPEGAVLSPNECDEDIDILEPVLVDNTMTAKTHERTPLLKGKIRQYTGQDAEASGRDLESLKALDSSLGGRFKSSIKSARIRVEHGIFVAAHPSAWDKDAILQAAVVQPANYIPAVILGLLLNVLDALSYGMILFPLGVPMFAELGPDGISMFYISCIISQLVYSCGGSVFKGGIGSEMIEVVPFFHSMAYAIVDHVGSDKPHQVLATTILAFSVSSIITGLAFYILGSLKLGSLIGFFPRHILIGCIGGVGFFLVLTGLEVSARLEGNFQYDLATLRKLFELDTLPLWSVPLALACVLLLIKRWVKHSLTDAVYFLSIIFVFYVVVAAVPSLTVEDLRGKGWIFEAPRAGNPWWHFYTLYDFGAVDWDAFAQTIPAMLALTFFGLLHVPINVPALALTTGEDNLDLDRELRAHGYSNALSGLCGSIQNYLVYTNTVLFVRAGANSRFAGVLLAAATAGIMVVGPVIIGYIPIMVVGALIFFLGFDLLREALIDTWGKAGNLEYLTILIIVLTMGIYDFVVGIGVGIILACVSYVFQSSQISAVRGVMPGSVANSTVRRHPMQRHYLLEVGSQIYVMRLAGFLFFGTIVGVEKEIRRVLDDSRFLKDPISYLVVDLSKVDGVDFSAAEAFTRVNRILNQKDVSLVLCGFPMDSSIGKNLANIGLFEEGDEVKFFEALNPALEFCENQMLKTFYQRRDVMLSQSTDQSAQPQSLDVPKSGNELTSLFGETISHSPRRGQMHRAAATTLVSHQDPSAQRQWQRYKQPLQLILQTFSFLTPDRNEEFWQRLVPYLEREVWPAGAVLYRRGDPADGFFLLQTGVLKANYDLEQGNFGEVIVAGATCGELPFFSEEKRTSTTVAERESTTWVLKQARWKELQEKDAEVANELLKIGLKLTSERMEAITKYMLVMGS